MQHLGSVSLGGSQAGRHAFTTPEVGWKKKASAKPVSAPEGIAGLPGSGSRLKQRSAPR